MSAPQWRHTEVLAWTEHDGPTRSPDGSGRTSSVLLAAALGGLLVGVLSIDTLCAEHRAWVRGLGTAAIVGVIGAAIALLRDSPTAPMLCLFSAAAGIGIGAIDATHNRTRGQIIVVAFAVVLLGAALLVARLHRLRRWDASLRRATQPETVDVRTDAAPNIRASDARDRRVSSHQ